MPTSVLRWRSPALAILCLGAAGAACGAPSKARVVLPTDVVPIEYRIDFTPDAAALTFSGRVEIDVELARPTRRIVLNSVDLQIERAELSGEAHAPSLSSDAKVQTATFTFDHLLPAGRRTLSLTYRGKIANRMAGLFMRQYGTPDGERRALFTQFENSDARRFVPCWDEPARKAVFRLSTTVDPALMAVGNMPVARTTARADGRARVEFAPTPRMSSYLLFFALGDFERVHRAVDGVDVGVVVKRGDTAQAEYALDAAAHLLPFYNEYFGARFPLPKLDLVAAPGHGTGFGAMENWGAIYFVEHAMLVDDRLSTLAERQGVYASIAHEMAHQWFGDLVTMAWWDDLWLNEGFASWMQAKATDHFHPEWKTWLQALGDKQGVMGTDARAGTHPVVTPIIDVEQASTAFDEITYSKGRQVIRTIEAVIGEERFRAGVRRYMRQHAYGNTTTDDFWRALQQGSGSDVTTLAHQLTLQPGVPLIVQRTLDCVGGRTTTTLAQERFSLGPRLAGRWDMPVIVRVVGGGTTQAVVSGPAGRVVRLAGCGAVVLNAGQTGYFRSQYSDDGLQAALGAYAALPAEDQLGIFQDASSLALAGRAPMSQVFDIAARMPAEVDPVVAIALIDQITEIDRLYEGLPTQAAWHRFARRLLRPMLKRIGARDGEGDGDNLVVERQSLLALLSRLDDPAVVADLRAQFETLRQPAAPPMAPALRRVVIASVALHADAATWEQLRALATAAPSEMEKSQLLARLGSVRDPALAAHALDVAFSGEMQRSDALRVLTRVSYLHPALALDFAVSHWLQIEPGLDLGGAATYVPRLVSQSSDPALGDKLDTFIDAHVNVDARGTAERVKAIIRYAAELRTQRLPDIDRLVAAAPPPADDASGNADPPSPIFSTMRSSLSIEGPVVRRR